ncbi:MAG: TIGR02301 family protein [Pseudaminobacter sp.]
MSRILLIFLVLAVAPVLSSGSVRAAEAPFEGSLMRLAEILGSLHFLRNLCGEEGAQWRGEMEKLLEAERPDPARRAKFIASFNRGYRSFEGAYARCTPSATEAIARYMKEGESLTREVAGRYGN